MLHLAQSLIINKIKKNLKIIKLPQKDGKKSSGYNGYIEY